MRRYITLVTIIPMFCITVAGQAFTGGLLAGITGNQIDGDDYKGYNKMGLTAGGYVQTKRNSRWQYQMEIKYFMKGAMRVSADNSIYYKEQLNYVEVPVLADFYLSTKMFAESGLSAGYLFSAREDKTGYGYIAPSPPFRKVELAYQLGLNYQFTSHIRGNLRFSYSLLPIRNNPGNQVWWFNRGQYNNSLSLCMYYRLR